MTNDRFCSCFAAIDDVRQQHTCVAKKLWESPGIQEITKLVLIAEEVEEEALACACVCVRMRGCACVCVCLLQKVCGKRCVHFDELNLNFVLPLLSVQLLLLLNHHKQLPCRHHHDALTASFPEHRE